MRLQQGLVRGLLAYFHCNVFFYIFLFLRFDGALRQLSFLVRKAQEEKYCCLLPSPHNCFCYEF